MAQARKFLFDRDFTRELPSAPVQPVEEEPPPDPATLPAYSEIDMAAIRAAARAEGFDAGKAEGLAEGSTGAEAALAHAVAHAAEALEALLPELEAKIDAAQKDAAALALAMARRIAGVALARQPLAEIEAMVAQCLADLDPGRSASRVVVRCAEALAAPLADQVAALTQRLGFPGKVVVLADPGIADTDCRVEWADGGAERNQAAIDAQVADSIARFLAATPGSAELALAKASLPVTRMEHEETEAAAAEWAEAPDPGIKNLDKGGKSKRVSEPEPEPAADPGVKSLDKGGKSKRISDPS